MGFIERHIDPATKSLRSGGRLRRIQLKAGAMETTAVVSIEYLQLAAAMPIRAHDGQIQNTGDVGNTADDLVGARLRPLQQRQRHHAGNRHA